PGGDESLARLAGDLDDAELAHAIRNLGGHDLSSLDEAYGAIDNSRPTIILAYTIKGYGLAVEGHPQNHSALLTEAQLGELAAQVGTVSPDVSSSTNLGGWVNKVSVWSAAERTDWFADDAETILHWREKPTGQHIELGIAETNLVGLLGELGATWSRWGQPLFPVG